MGRSELPHRAGSGFGPDQRGAAAAGLAQRFSLVRRLSRHRRSWWARGRTQGRQNQVFTGSWSRSASQYGTSPPTTLALSTGTVVSVSGNGPYVFEVTGVLVKSPPPSTATLLMFWATIWPRTSGPCSGLRCGRSDDQPTARRRHANVSQAASFTVVATSLEPLSYLWRKERCHPYR